MFSVVAADVDGDGDVDAVAGSRGHDLVAWYEQEDASFDERIVRLFEDRTLCVFAADVDGDGDVDLLSSADGGDVAWYENDGAQSFARRVVETLDASLMMLIHRR